MNLTATEKAGEKAIIPVWPEFFFHLLAKLFQIDEFVCWQKAILTLSFKYTLNYIVFLLLTSSSMKELGAAQTIWDNTPNIAQSTSVGLSPVKYGFDPLTKADIKTLITLVIFYKHFTEIGGERANIVNGHLGSFFFRIMANCVFFHAQFPSHCL